VVLNAPPIATWPRAWCSSRSSSRKPPPTSSPTRSWTMGKIPEFKFCAAKVEPVREGVLAAAE
jgi:hypothetical protein